MKKFRYAVEACLLHVLMMLFGMLSADRASALGGWIAHTIGPHMAVSRKALANIRASLPGLSDAEQRKILRDMWDNLGRVMAEYPHLEFIARERTQVEDVSLFHKLRDDGQPALIVSAHLANWEVFGPTALLHGGFELDLVYRAPNNPRVDKLLAQARAIRPDLRTMPKSKTGARDIVRSLIEKRHVGILIDQKYNEGVPALFFGRAAMTSPAFVQLAQKFKCPLVLARLERTDGVHFKVSAVEIPYEDAEGKALPVETVIAAAHAQLESWIRERPGQWLWLHKRWSERAERDYALLAAKVS